jgi:hypothetical protein
MKKVLLTVAFFFFVGSVAFGQVYVKFQVNMAVAIYNQKFNPATGTVEARGDYQHVAGEADWSTSTLLLTDGNTDSVYTRVIMLDDSSKGRTYYYKYVVDNNYEGIANNRSFTAPANTGDTTYVTVAYFNDDTKYTGPPLHNKVKFVADLTAIFGTGPGHFDATKDTIEVRGLDWGSPAYYVSGNKTLHQNGFTPTQYETDTIVVAGILGDSASWKFKAYPDKDFVNSGWEGLPDAYPTVGTNRWYHIVSDTTNIQTVSLAPSIEPSQPPITRDVTLTFRVNMNGTITDYHNKYTIPYDSIQFVGLRSGLVGLGDWTSGNWNPSDTANGEQHMRVLHDDGLNGDVTAGDKIWSDTVIIPSGTPGGPVDYKYGAYYGTANDTANGGTDIMDNEMGFGTNHNFTLTSNDLTLTDNFGVLTAIERDQDATTPVLYKLSQNYPNPFNPSTTIQYNLPVSGKVVLKIFDVVGREVTTLVNEEQQSGVYKVTFDASKIASGIYFYRLQSGSFISTKKMILLK